MVTVTGRVAPKNILREISIVAVPWSGDHNSFHSFHLSPRLYEGFPCSLPHYNPQEIHFFRRQVMLTSTCGPKIVPKQRFKASLQHIAQTLHIWTPQIRHAQGDSVRDLCHWKKFHKFTVTSFCKRNCHMSPDFAL